MIVGHTRLGTLSEYQKCKFRIMAHVNTGQTYYVSDPVTLTSNQGWHKNINDMIYININIKGSIMIFSFFK